MAVKFHILLLNGPNINMLGTREPEKYGPLTLAEIVNRLTSEAAALNVSLDHLQSNAEHALIDRIHQAKDNVDYILINPAAFTHTSVAMCMHANPSASTRICQMSPLASFAGWGRMVIHTLYRRR